MSTIKESAMEAFMRRWRQCGEFAVFAYIGLSLTLAGCGGGSEAPSPTPAIQNAVVTGQFNLVLTSTNGRGTTNIYTNFSQAGTSFTGAASTLVCPLNDLSQCMGDAATGISIVPVGTVKAANVTVVISFTNSAGADTIMMVGSATGTNLVGTYTDSLGDSGVWSASSAAYAFGPPPAVHDYNGTFNSTLNPLLLAPTISIEVGQDASSNLTGAATIANSPCVNSLTLSGQAIGDAFTLTDTANKVSIIVLPTLPAAGSYNFSYKFDPAAASCAGDVGRGVVTLNPGSFDY